MFHKCSFFILDLLDFFLCIGSQCMIAVGKFASHLNLSAALFSTTTIDALKH